MKTKSRKFVVLSLIPVIMLAFASCKKDAGASADILKGKWLRPDGGYTIDIRSIDSASGKVDAAYFNPNPIKVAAAQLRQENGALNVFIELRDTGYPGCTYKLTYDRQQDQLKGVYYQAAVQESYNIYFVRLGEGK
jgi:hypothetical protein